MAEKMIDKDRFWWNPETKEKKFSHYTDGSEVKCDSAFVEEAKKACMRMAMKEIEGSPKAKSKPFEKREHKKAKEPVKKEEPVVELSKDKK